MPASGEARKEGVSGMRKSMPTRSAYINKKFYVSFLSSQSIRKSYQHPLIHHTLQSQSYTHTSSCLEDPRDHLLAHAMYPAANAKNTKGMVRKTVKGTIADTLT